MFKNLPVRDSIHKKIVKYNRHFVALSSILKLKVVYIKMMKCHATVAFNVLNMTNTVIRTLRHGNGNTSGVKKILPFPIYINEQLQQIEKHRGG